MRPMLILLSVAALLTGAACFRADIRSHDIRVPELSTEEQAAMIRAAMSYTTDTAAVRRVEVNLAERRVTIVYDSRRTARRNLEHAIADLGFHANDLPPTPRRRPPAPAPSPEPTP